MVAMSEEFRRRWEADRDLLEIDELEELARLRMAKHRAAHLRSIIRDR
jgi:hypothetical protein